MRLQKQTSIENFTNSILSSTPNPVINNKLELYSMSQPRSHVITPCGYGTCKTEGYSHYQCNQCNTYFCSNLHMTLHGNETGHNV